MLSFSFLRHSCCRPNRTGSQEIIRCGNKIRQNRCRYIICFSICSNCRHVIIFNITSSCSFDFIQIDSINSQRLIFASCFIRITRNRVRSMFNTRNFQTSYRNLHSNSSLIHFIRRCLTTLCNGFGTTSQCNSFCTSISWNIFRSINIASLQSRYCSSSLSFRFAVVYPRFNFSRIRNTIELNFRSFCNFLCCTTSSSCQFDINLSICRYNGNLIHTIFPCCRITYSFGHRRNDSYCHRAIAFKAIICDIFVITTCCKSQSSDSQHQKLVHFHTSNI